MEKAPLLPQTEGTDEAAPRHPATKRPSYLHAATIAIILGIFWLSTTRWNCGHSHQVIDQETRVPLEVHIM